MKKLSGILLIIIICSFTIWGGNFQISASGGYGIPLGCTGSGIEGPNVLIDYKETATGSISQWKEIYFSGGSGLKADVSLLWYFRPDIAVFVSSGYSFLGGGKINVIGKDIAMSYVPINLGAEIRTQPFFSIFSSYIRIAPGLYFPWTRVSYQSNSDFINVEYKTGFGFSSSLGISARMGKKALISFEVNPVYAFAEQKRIQFNYSDGSTETWEYIRNTMPLPAAQEADSLHKTYYYHWGERVSFSSLSFRIATSFSF
jgi:hypothetical protein